MGVMDLLQEIAAFVQSHCERSVAISRKVVLVMRLLRASCPSPYGPEKLFKIVPYDFMPQSRCSFAMTVGVLNWCSLLIYRIHRAIIYPTHPPRLSGFDREAQQWRVFYARNKELAA
ncbi:MAG: hypothetical protein BMS9Abin31_0406 [Gammaproteobacteria bacterium]|nr:MAG: hypothetical protein BMS9Abin31_0406 [Gammaproteobacteria bacterium]